MKSNSSDVVLSPDIRYWIVTNVLIIAISFIILTVSFYADNQYINLAGCVLSLSFLGLSFYRFVVLLTTKWIITEEQIKIYKGIFNRTINYIELYRVFDYEVKQNMILAAFHIKNIYIHSGDRSTPLLEMYGIHCKGVDYISVIRDRVELQKHKKSIYEFTNR
ncbi:PH domain-containing protein [Phocaeicola barnesiae]|jgi:membrane protein YdbS with pleckstrin-like domain|uniref:PH domain-containing protein n=1 Tax=Phocaeicola barnesiae TaxID=376804 RepID=UPI0025A3D9D2|nr:PH domain-containing protein [Phocaeicola barnesiae]MDM8242860.1 PH domain-containing protein [Phocaeicola barnesiae]